MPGGSATYSARAGALGGSVSSSSLRRLGAALAESSYRKTFGATVDATTARPEVTGARIMPVVLKPSSDCRPTAAGQGGCGPPGVVGGHNDAERSRIAGVDLVGSRRKSEGR